MRNLVKIVMVVMLASGLSSCEKIKSIFDVEFDTTLSGEMDIEIQDDVKKSTNEYEFQTSTLIDPLDDEDIDEYVDNIKDFAVNLVEAEVMFVSKENIIFKAGTSFSVYDANDKVSWTLGSDWLVTEGTLVTLEDISEVYDAVADILAKKQPFSISVNGTSTEKGIFVTIGMNIETMVTANPL